MCCLSIIVPCFRIFIIIDRTVGTTGHRKDVVGGLNAREKQMHNLAMANILNPELILDYPIFQVNADS